VSTLAPGTPIEVWFQDEMRVGQKNSLVYQWAKTGSRPRQPKDQRYENAYVFGAVCPSRDTGVALIMPHADTEAMQAHLEAIGRAVAPSAHALLILEGRVAHHAQAQPTQQSHPCPATASMPRTQRSREHLAVSVANHWQPREMSTHVLMLAASAARLCCCLGWRRRWPCNPLTASRCF
jgi:hypothetical protein